MHLNDEGMVVLEHDHFLKANGADTVLSHHDIFAHGFHREKLIVTASKVDQVDFCLRSLTKQLDGFKLVENDLVAKRVSLVNMLRLLTFLEWIAVGAVTVQLNKQTDVVYFLN